MKRWLIAAASGAALALAACETGPEVHTDTAPGADFSRLHTYTWVVQQPPTGMNPIAFERIHDAIDQQLASKGFVKGEPADFAVSFTVGRRDKVEVDDFGPYGAFYPGVGFGPGWGWGYTDFDVRTITEGSLVIDVFDANTKKPLWHGIATEEIGSQVTPKQIDQAVASVLTKFPPRQG